MKNNQIIELLQEYQEMLIADNKQIKKGNSKITLQQYSENILQDYKEMLETIINLLEVKQEIKVDKEIKQKSNKKQLSSINRIQNTLNKLRDI